MAAVMQQKLAVATRPCSQSGGDSARASITAGTNPLKLGQGFAVDQRRRELLELLLASQAYRAAHRLALRIEKIQLGDAVDVIPVHEVLPARIVDIHHHHVESVGLGLFKLQHRRRHFTTDLTPVGVKLHDCRATVAEGHIRFKRSPGKLVQGRTALQTSASQGEPDGQSHSGDHKNGTLNWTQR